MRHICYNLLLVMAVLFAAGAMEAQITITKSDVDANFINKTWYSIHDSITSTYNLGSPSSSAQVFNFGSMVIYPTATVDTLNFVVPSTQPGVASFPTAAVCYSFSQTSIESGFKVTVTEATYFSSEATGAYQLGGALRQQITPTPPPPFVADTTYVSLNKPKEPVIPLPLTLGLARSSVDTFTNQSGTNITKLTYTADAFGTLTLPGGSAAGAIRVIQDKQVTTMSGGGTTVYPKEREIVYYTQDVTQLHFSVDTTFTSGSVQLTQYVYTTRNGSVTAVQDNRMNVPNRMSLYQNYPNPFNPSTMIQFDLPSSSSVTLKVYDVLGREVGTLLNEKQLQSGSHTVRFDASALTSGMYFYKLTTGKNVSVKKMLLMK